MSDTFTESSYMPELLNTKCKGLSCLCGPNCVFCVNYLNECNGHPFLNGPNTTIKVGSFSTSSGLPYTTTLSY